VVRRSAHPGLQGFFYTFPDLSEYSTGDLYKPHPSLPYHWIHYGRADNVIVFSNGEKLNPVATEDIVQGHPRVNGALVVGAGRFQAALLVEPVSHPKDAEEEHELLQGLWLLLAQANAETVAHGRIDRQFILISSPEKPFLRTGKGTVQRKGTADLYAQEIQQLYDTAERNPTNVEALRLDDATSEASLIDWIQQSFGSQQEPSQKLDPDVNFFSAGVDSLVVMNASRKLRVGIMRAGHETNSNDMSPRVIYNNPTPRRLANHILESIVNRRGPDEDQDKVEERQEMQVMEQLYEKYTQNLIAGRHGRPSTSYEMHTVLLTGSTGNLGSYLLDQLVRSPRVAKVICLNRARDGGATQQAAGMRDRGLILAEDYRSKVEFYRFDVSQDRLGIAQDLYARLLSEVDGVIHCAWPVNFNFSTETFEPHIKGVRSLADMAAVADKRTAVLFISSVSTAERWDPSSGPVPETRLDDWRLPGSGYGRSKMIGSLILDDAAKVGDFPVATIRVGQIAGPEAEAAAGMWNKQEWLPSLIASSLHLSSLPHELGQANRVDWVPVERIASLVLDILGVRPATSSGIGDQGTRDMDLSGYFHGVNSSTTTWDKLAPAVQQFYGGRIKDLVSIDEWVARLESSRGHTLHEDDATTVSNPGLKLLDTYRALAASQSPGSSAIEPVVFDMQRTNGRSRAMNNATAITPELMRRWCAQWNF
jgi:thioester reductase-like protein